MNLDGYRFTESHEWAHVADGLVYVGITDHAQDEITEVVYVELPEPGGRAVKGEELLLLDSVKASFSIYAPVSGTITQVNDILGEQPGLVNTSPYEEGWMVAITPNDISEMDDLLTAADYERLIESES
jgi:glycine cleavage system H protein